MALKTRLLEVIHTGIAGHLGSYKTKAHVGSRAYWFHWRRDVDIYCKKCRRCNEFYRCKKAPKQGRLQPTLTGSPTEKWSIDLAGMFPRSVSGYVYILSAICTFTKYMVLVPLRDKTAKTVATALWNNVFLRYGCGEIVSDLGLEFHNSMLSELCRLLGIAQAHTTAYNPRANGQVERSHATINSMLAKCIDDDQTHWSDHLQRVEFCYNASTHESTTYSPFFLMHGFEPRWDVDFYIGDDRHPRYSVNDYADYLITSLEKAHEIARKHLRTTANRMRDWYDRKVHVQDFKPGDSVRILNLRLYPGQCYKWTRRYADVGTVLEKINNVTYKVQCDAWHDLVRIVHVDKLKRAFL